MAKVSVLIRVSEFTYSANKKRKKERNTDTDKYLTHGWMLKIISKLGFRSKVTCKYI